MTLEAGEKEIIEIDMGHRGPEEGEIRGDAKLASAPKAKEVFDDAQIRLWKNQLMMAYPDTDEAILNEILNAYQTHPEVVSQIVKEFKEGQHQVDHKERVVSGTVEGCVQVNSNGEDLFAATGEGAR